MLCMHINPFCLLCFVSHLVHSAEKHLLNILFTLKSLACVKRHTRQIQWAVRSLLNHGRIHRAALILRLTRYSMQIYM